MFLADKNSEWRFCPELKQFERSSEPLATIFGGSTLMTEHLMSLLRRMDIFFLSLSPPPQARVTSSSNRVVWGSTRIYPGQALPKLVIFKKTTLRLQFGDQLLNIHIWALIWQRVQHPSEKVDEPSLSAVQQLIECIRNVAWKCELAIQWEGKRGCLFSVTRWAILRLSVETSWS